MIIITANHEPEHEVAEKLLAMADEAGYSPAVVKTERAEGLVFDVPDEIGQPFVDNRADWWPREDVTADEDATDDEENTDNPPAKRRGRPPKNPTE